MAPPRRGVYGQHGQPSISMDPPYSLTANNHSKEAYRDLLIFEERLKQNSSRLTRQRRKYEGFLISLMAITLLLGYNAVVKPPAHTAVQFAISGLLLIALVTLVLFFATGVYSEKIAYAYKFVPQANRGLRYFNIYLNVKQVPRSFSLNPMRLFFPVSGSPTSPSDVGRTGSFSSGTSSPARTARPARASSLSSSSSSSSTMSRSRSSASSTRSPAFTLAPLPPSSNPRGEIIFSSKVSQHYRDGYEKYRSDWERKRKVAKHELSWKDYLLSFVAKRSLVGKVGPASSALAKGHAVSKSMEKATLPEKSQHVTGAVSQAELSDSSTASIPPAEKSSMTASSTISSPPELATSRGRDTRTRPLSRTSSSSSISSSVLSLSPPASRKSSPVRHTVSSGTSGGRSLSNISPTSSSPPTPTSIPEEDETEEAEVQAGYFQQNAKRGTGRAVIQKSSMASNSMWIRGRAESFNEFLEEMTEVRGET